jgi:cytochrome P450
MTGTAVAAGEPSPDLDFLPLSEEFSANPYPVYRTLRETAPVYWHETFHAWIVSRYEHVRALMEDSRLTLDPSAWEGHVPTSLPPRGFCEWFRSFPILRNAGPDGLVRARRLVHAAFTPSAMRRIEAQVRTIVDRRVDAVSQPLDRGCEIDVVEAYSGRIPLEVIGRVLGVAPAGEHAARFRRDAPAILGCLHPFLSPEAAARIDEAGASFCEFVAESIRARRERPSDDLLSDLVNANERGDAGLDDESLVALIVSLLVVGTETTAHTISMGIYLMARHHAQRRLLLDGRVPVESAVEEILRFEPPTKLVIRYAREPVEVYGRRVDPGQLVMLLPTSANRDPAKFPDPDRFDVTRDAREHLSFGIGPHFCLGAWLARMQLRLAIGDFVARFPDLEVPDEGVSWIPEFMFRGPRTMRVRRRSVVGRAPTESASVGGA